MSELKSLHEQLERGKTAGAGDGEGDSLDSFMRSIRSHADRGKMNEIRLRIHQLNKVGVVVVGVVCDPDHYRKRHSFSDLLKQQDPTIYQKS